jgi:hypothetical protein
MKMKDKFMGAVNSLGQHYVEEGAYNSKKTLGQHTMELNSEQAKKDLLNLLLPPDQVNLKFDTDGDEGSEGFTGDWKVDAIDVTKAKIPYPLSPADADHWFSDGSTNALLDDLTDAEVTDRSGRFFSAMEQLWADDLATVLMRKFVTVPQAVIAAIAIQAEKMSAASGELADKLIVCVQETLPMWAEEDLRVFARPLAYAMRGEVASDPSSKDWAGLSEIEQAKLTLAIAKYAMEHVQA